MPFVTMACLDACGPGRGGSKGDSDRMLFFPEEYPDVGAPAPESGGRSEPRAERRMCFTAGVEVVHMPRGRQFRELEAVPSRWRGLCVIYTSRNRQSLSAPIDFFLTVRA